MKHQINKTLLSLIVVLSSSVCLAQQAKVIKVKGQQAIVQFPSGQKPQVGQTLEIGDSFGAIDDEGERVAGKTRHNSLALATELKFVNNSKTSKSTTAFMVSGSFGWNTGVMEFGPRGSIRSESTDGSTSRAVLVGGFFDYNFVPNTVGVETVYGLGAFGEVGQQSTNSTSGSLVNFFGGGNIKWFPLRTTVALRGDAGLGMERSIVGNEVVSMTGFVVTGGLSVYF